MAPRKKPYKSLSRSGKYYRDNPKARKKKAKKDKEVNSRPEQVKKRVESKRRRKAALKRGADPSKDYDHATGRMTSQKKNRGRKGEGGRKKKR